MFDVLCIISNSLDQENIVNFRTVCKLYDKVFIEYWIIYNSLKLYNTHFTYIPKWLKYSNLILSNCSIDRDLIYKFPNGTVLYKTKMFDPITEDINTTNYKHLDRIKEYYGIDLKFIICNCGHKSFCDEDICSSLDFWLPEYKNINSIPDLNYIDEIFGQDYPNMSNHCHDQLLELIKISELDNVHKFFLMYLLCLRNINDKSGRWFGIQYITFTFINFHEYNDEDERYIPFFGYCNDIFDQTPGFTS